MIYQPRVVQIPAGNFAFEVKLRNPNEQCSCLYSVFQTEPVATNHRLRLIGELYESCTEEFQHDYLRTKNQVGYITQSMWKSNLKVGTFKHILQSSTFTCAAIEEILQDFLINKVSKFLEEMSDEVFGKFRKSLLQAKLQKFASLKEENLSHWWEIQDNLFRFNLKENEATMVPKLEKKDVIEFYNTYILPKSKMCRKLSVHVVSTSNKKQPKEAETKLCEGFNWIPDRDTFIKDCRVFPCLVSYKTEEDELKLE